jgi:broad specificity phosphatase PhoE
MPIPRTNALSLASLRGGVIDRVGIKPASVPVLNPKPTPVAIASRQASLSYAAKPAAMPSVPAIAQRPSLAASSAGPGKPGATRATPPDPRLKGEGPSVIVQSRSIQAATPQASAAQPQRGGSFGLDDVVSGAGRLYNGVVDAVTHPVQTFNRAGNAINEHVVEPVQEAYEQYVAPVVDNVVEVAAPYIPDLPSPGRVYDSGRDYYQQNVSQHVPDGIERAGGITPQQPRVVNTTLTVGGAAHGVNYNSARGSTEVRLPDGQTVTLNGRANGQQIAAAIAERVAPQPGKGARLTAGSNQLERNGNWVLNLATGENFKVEAGTSNQRVIEMARERSGETAPVASAPLTFTGGSEAKQQLQVRTVPHGVQVILPNGAGSRVYPAGTTHQQIIRDARADVGLSAQVGTAASTATTAAPVGASATASASSPAGPFSSRIAELSADDTRSPAQALELGWLRAGRGLGDTIEFFRTDRQRNPSAYEFVPEPMAPLVTANNLLLSMRDGLVQQGSALVQPVVEAPWGEKAQVAGGIVGDLASRGYNHVAGGLADMNRNENNEAWEALAYVPAATGTLLFGAAAETALPRAAVGRAGLPAVPRIDPRSATVPGLTGLRPDAPASQLSASTNGPPARSAAELPRNAQQMTFDDAMVVNSRGEMRPSREYINSEEDLVRPDGVPDRAAYVTNIYYRHGQTNANKGEPMRGPDGEPVAPGLHLIDVDGVVVPGSPFFAGNKLGNWVQLTDQAREQASALVPQVADSAPFVDVLIHSPVQRATDTMTLATRGVEDLPPPESMTGMAERGVGGLFGQPKTPGITRIVGSEGFVPPVQIRSERHPWSLTPDVTGGETVDKFYARLGNTNSDLATVSYERGNALSFSHQYTIGVLQDLQYRMTGSAPELGMPEYGIHNPPALREDGTPNPRHKPDLPLNPTGFMGGMDAGHDIPNGAELVRPGWVWTDDQGHGQFVPAPKGYSDISAPPVPPAPSSTNRPDTPSAPLPPAPNPREASVHPRTTPAQMAAAPGAPGVVPRYTIIEDPGNVQLPTGSIFRRVQRFDIQNDASLNQAVEHSKAAQGRAARGEYGNIVRLLSGVVQPTPVYTAHSRELMNKLLTNGDFKVSPEGRPQNVFYTHQVHTGDYHHFPVQLDMLERRPESSSRPPAWRVDIDPDAATPFRVNGSGQWQGPATAEEAQAFFDAAFERDVNTGELIVPARALTRAEIEDFPRHASARAQTPARIPDHIAVGPHVDFTQVHPTREQAHAAFGERVGDIASTRLATGGSLADQPMQEYGAQILPKADGYQLLPPYVDVANRHGEISFSAARSGASTFERESMRSEMRRESADATHSHPPETRVSAGRHVMATATEPFSIGDIQHFASVARQDPNYGFSVHTPGSRTTQILTLSDTARNNMQVVAPALQKAVADNSLGILKQHPEWFDFGVVQVDFRGQTSRTDWMDAMRNSHSPEMRAVAAEVERQLGRPPSLHDLVVRDAIYKAARRLDAIDP